MFKGTTTKASAVDRSPQLANADALPALLRALGIVQAPPYAETARIHAWMLLLPVELKFLV